MASESISTSESLPITLCEGCYQLFSSSGFSRHVAQTMNPACRAAYQDAQNDITSSGSEDEDEDGSPGSQSPRQFVGDIFGTHYTAEELGQPEEIMDVDIQDVPTGAEHDEDSERGDEEDGREEWRDEGDSDDDAVEELDEGLRPHWEPPAPSPVDSDDSDMDQSNNPSSSGTSSPSHNDSPEQPHESNPRERIEIGLRAKIHRVLYPLSSTAGQPIAAESTSSAHGAYTQYEASLRSSTGSTENVYAPFASRINWQMAYWAKQRRVGSIAFTDLLKIPGMSLYCLCVAPPLTAAL